MARLKCPNCGKTFEKNTIANYGTAGVTGAKVGFGFNLLVWPFTTRIYATCPMCNEKGWLKVLPLWAKERNSAQ